MRALLPRALRHLPRTSFILQPISNTPRARLASKAQPILRNLRQANALAQSLRAQLPRRSVQLLDEGALHGLRAGADGRLDAPSLRLLIQKTPPGVQRHETVTAFNVLLRHLHVALKCCQRCLYPRARCVCSRIRVATPPTRARVWVFQHFAEFGRANNSGSLLCLVAGARRALRGIAEDQDALIEALDHAHLTQSACILFPTDDALDVASFVRERRERLGLRKAREIPLCAVVLDGTGRQARNLERFLPSHIPRVKLSLDEEFGSRSWLNPVRMQTEAHRVCSAQAAASVLEIVGEKEAANAIEQAVKIVVGDAARDRDGLPKAALPPFLHGI